MKLLNYFMDASLIKISLYAKFQVKIRKHDIFRWPSQISLEAHIHLGFLLKHYVVSVDKRSLESE
jgi:hypothetical protein